MADRANTVWETTKAFAGALEGILSYPLREVRATLLGYNEAGNLDRIDRKISGFFVAEDYFYFQNSTTIAAGATEIPYDSNDLEKVADTYAGGFSKLVAGVTANAGQDCRLRVRWFADQALTEVVNVQNQSFTSTNTGIEAPFIADVVTPYFDWVVTNIDANPDTFNWVFQLR